MTDDEKPWWASTVVWAAIVGFAFALLSLAQDVLGFQLPAALNEQRVLELVLAGVGVWTLIGRMKRDIKPVSRSLLPKRKDNP